jgi:hypothetical protein
MADMTVFHRDNPRSAKQYRPQTPCYMIPREMKEDEWEGKLRTVVTLLYETCRQQEEKVRRNR